MVTKVEKQAELAAQMQLVDIFRNFQAGSAVPIADDVKLEWLESRLQVLEQYWNEFSERHIRLCAWSSELDTTYFSQDAHTSVENYFLFAKAFLRSKIKQETPNPLLEHQMIQNQRNPPVLNSHLPRINIPKFSGKQREWESFKGMFTAMIIHDETLDSVRKLHYLLSSLTDTAAKVLGRTKFEVTSFEVAWEKLVRRFDNVNVRLFSHLENFIGCPIIQKRSASEINRILDVADETMQGLKDLHCPVDQYDVWFVHIIVKKLDSKTQESWNIHNEEMETMPNYKDLVKFLQNRAHSLIQTSVEQDEKSGKKSFGKEIRDFYCKKNNVHATTLEKSKYECPQCKNAHSLAECNVFKKLNALQRRDFVKKNQLCFNCMLGRHPSKFCRNRSRCTVCNSKHHSLLHSDASNFQSRVTSCSQERSSDSESVASGSQQIDNGSQPVLGSHAAFPS